GWEFPGRGADVEAGVVDEHGRGAELLGRTGDEGGRLPGVGHVRLDGGGASAVGDDLLGQRRGLLAAAGGVIRLQRQIPFKIALELALTGEPITAERAHELGLVNRVAPQGKALDVALELARTIAS